MKIVTWNCQGAFRKKYLPLAAMQPDLAVIQECECLEKLTWKQGNAPVRMFWFGSSPNKGLGVFSWTNLEYDALENFDETIRYCIPLRVTAPYAFHTVAVWAMDHPIEKLSYSAQIYQALAAYRAFMLANDTVFLGDFNSSPRTTPRSRLGNHTTLSTSLADLGMISAYHLASMEKPGKETRGTYFRGRNPQKPSHIDYAFIPTRWLRRIRRVEVGKPEEWLAHSDHCPLMVEIVPKTADSITG